MHRKTGIIFGTIIILLFVALLISWYTQAIASSKKLLLFPISVYADQSKAYLGRGITSMLISRISGLGITILPENMYIDILSEQEAKGVISQQRAQELAGSVRADYAIFGSVTTIGGGYSLDLSLLELEKDESTLSRISKTLEEDQFIPQLSDVAYQLKAIMQGKEIPVKKPTGKPAEQIGEKTPATKPKTAKGIFSQVEGDKRKPKDVESGLLFKPTREYQGFKPTGTISVGMSIMAFDMGDVDGKQGVELLVLGRNECLLYTRQGASFVLRDTIKAGFGEDFLKVSSGDVDHNGRAEIYVVSRYGIRARTTVFEWDGTFKRLDRRAGHMRVVTDSISKKSLLLFQDSKAGEFISGRIYMMNMEKGGAYTRGKPLPKLNDARFYTLAPFDIDNDGTLEWTGLGEEFRLHVWDRQGNIIWNGDENLRGTNNAIAVGNAPRGDPPPRIMFHSRLLATDIDGDGSRDVVVVKNIPLVQHVANFRVYTKSNLIAYRMEGARLSPAWRTGDIDWCINDMQTDGHTLFLAAQKGKILNVGKESGQIMWFE